MRPISRIEHPDQLATDRDLQAQQLLDGQHEGVLLVHRRDVVEPVEVARCSGVGPRLDQLLGAAVQQADVRIDPSTTSPSSSSTSRSTPCAAGCCGPKFNENLADRRLPGMAYCSAFSSPGSA